MPYIWGPSVRTLRISLVSVEPIVWRRLVVPSETKLPKFNRLLQAVMGWEGYHLHIFEIEHLLVGAPDEEDDAVIDERRLTVKQLLPRFDSRLRWAYDFGDNWKHEVVVEAIEEPSNNVRYPMCIDGERACPPEDCGGVSGYEELITVLADERHEEHENLLAWAPPGFDPEVFDLVAANRRLRRVR